LGRQVAVLALVGLFLAGCGQSEDQARAQKEQAAMTVTTPNATAKDNAKNLAKSNMSPEVKAVLGSAGH